MSRPIVIAERYKRYKQWCCSGVEGYPRLGLTLLYSLVTGNERRQLKRRWLPVLDFTPLPPDPDN